MRLEGGEEEGLPVVALREASLLQQLAGSPHIIQWVVEKAHLCSAPAPCILHQRAWLLLARVGSSKYQGVFLRPQPSPKLHHA